MPARTASRQTRSNSENKNPNKKATRSSNARAVNSVKEEHSGLFEVDEDSAARKPSAKVPKEEDDAPVIIGERKSKKVPTAKLVFKKEENQDRSGNDMNDHPAPQVKVESLDEKSFFNPKWKVELPMKKKKGEEFDLRLVTRRIDEHGIRPFTITNANDALLNAYISRNFFSDTYGGSPQATVPGIKNEKYLETGYKDFAFFNPQYNPYAPQRPGFPGLIYRARIEDWPKVLKTFVRVDSSKWLYLGTYKLIKAEPLTQQEWLDTPESVKDIWPKHVCKRDWGRYLRNKVGMRNQLGREPTVAEYEGADEVGKTVHASDIADALDAGEERLQTWVLKCIGYDKDMWKEMVEKSKNWTPKKKETGGNGNRRKRQDSDDDDGDSEEPLPRSKKRRTRG